MSTVKTECLEIKIAFNIPEWFPPDRLETSTPVYYDKHHVYAGSFSHTNDDNTALAALFRLKGVIETYSGSWVVIQFPTNVRDIQKWIRKTSAKLDRFFNRYKEARQ
jgi:hypothetical protein